MLNYVWPSRKHQDIWPKWIDFQSLARDMRCPTCDALLCKAIWTTLEVEINCSHCKTINNFHIKDLYEPLFKTIPTVTRDNLIAKIKQIIS
jgi:phage FluMu protein Com